MTGSRKKILPALGLFGCIAALGVSALSIGASCIIPDKGIIVLEEGYRWCTRAEDAQAWLNPLFKENVTGSDNEWVKGCICVDNEEDHALLQEWAGVPGGPAEHHPDYDDFDLLRDQILLAAREACQDVAEGIGPHNDCEAVLTDMNLLFDDGRSEDCRLEALYSDTDTEGDPIDPNPFDLSSLSCSAGVCTCSQSLIDDMMARPSAFGLDSARVEVEPDGLYFRGVRPGDVAYIAGVRSGDKLLTLGGTTINDMGDVADALVNLAGSSNATATLEDAYGSTVTIEIRIR